MLARATIVTALLASAALLLTSAASGATASGRYARCSDPHPKTYTTCPDVLTMAGPASGSLQFMLERKYCSSTVFEPGNPGVWDFFDGIHIRKGKISGGYTYNNDIPDGQDAPDDVGVAFRFSGTVVSAHRIRLVVTGKVTKAGSTVADCAGVTFTETHVLKSVSF